MVGDRVRVISFVEPESWFFKLVSGGTLRVETLWRIVRVGKIQATSADHGHRFGLPQPVDSAARAKLSLLDATVRQASIIQDTGDVVVDFDNDSRLEVELPKLTKYASHRTTIRFTFGGKDILLKERGKASLNSVLFEKIQG